MKMRDNRERREREDEKEWEREASNERTKLHHRNH